MPSINERAKSSLNARMGAVALLVAALALLALATQQAALTPLRLLTTGISTLGVWAFCDEMGMKKPLNRAGFVSYAFALFARLSALLEPQSPAVGRYYLLYAFALLLAMLLWSVAYLHRQRELKVIGAVGAMATLAPIVALLAGHLALGAGAIFGIGSLLAAAEGATMNDFSFIKSIDFMFSIWALVSAWFLWFGHIRSAD